jgi:hypothetical protein
MPILRFAPNVPQELRLHSLEGRVVDSQFGGQQHMFTAAEGMFYVSDKVGSILTDQFRKLGVKPGDPVEICKTETANGSGRKTQWIVTAYGGDAQEPPEPPSELERKLADSIAVAESRKQAARAQTATMQPEWAQHLVAQSIALVDAYAEVLRHASQHQNIRGEDVRSLFLSAFINVSKSANGGRNAA